MVEEGEGRKKRKRKRKDWRAEEMAQHPYGGPQPSVTPVRGLQPALGPPKTAAFVWCTAIHFSSPWIISLEDLKSFTQINIVELNCSSVIESSLVCPKLCVQISAPQKKQKFKLI